jgi:hypothetical protein
MDDLTRDSLLSFLFVNAAICLACVAITIFGEYKRLAAFNRLVAEIKRRNQ